MPEPEISAEILALFERIALAIRRELGEAIDAFPGCRTPEDADPMNRGFRAAVQALLEANDTPVANLDRTVSGTLRRLAERRLATEGWDDRQVKFLLEEEPGSPDDWLAFLILSARQQIEPLLDPDDHHYD